MPVVAALASDAHRETGRSYASFTALSRSVSRCNNEHTLMCYFSRWIAKKNKIKEREEFWVGEEKQLVPEKNLSLPTKKAYVLLFGSCTSCHYVLRKSSNVQKKKSLQKGWGVSPPEAALVVSELKCTDAVSKKQSRVCFPYPHGHYVESADALWVVQLDVATEYVQGNVAKPTPSVSFHNTG